MTLLSLLPIGSALVCPPAAVVLFLQGYTLKAVVVLTVGSLFIGFIDNFLRPRLIGKDSKMPDSLVMVSTLGGLVFINRLCIGAYHRRFICHLLGRYWEKMPKRIRLD